ncbi:hypothetical protein IW148_002282 [Coemansia sp. RSA 1199]|nr:hypothetical protein IW148_002282 [Coemansia sp. RSA 1199]
MKDKLGSKKRRVEAEKESAKAEAESTKAKDEVRDAAAEHLKDKHISFKSADEIQRALDSTDVDMLIQGFTHLREHIRICNRPAEGHAAEVRVLRESNRRIVYEWAEQSQGFAAILAAWTFAQTHTVARLEGLIPITVGRLLQVLDTAETFNHGSQLARLVLDNFMRAIHRAFSTPRSSACAAMLHLLCQLVEFGRGEHADALRQQFDWTMNSLATVPGIRSSVVGYSVRRLWTRFVMGFFAAERCQSAAELLRVRGLVGGLFRGVEKDSYQDIHALLAQSFDHIVMNMRIARAEKRRVFGVPLMGHLAKAARNAEAVVPQTVGVNVPMHFVPGGSPGETITNDSVAELIVRFFRGMMTHPGYGICYRQHGLYTVRSVAEAGDGMDELNNGLILRVLVSCIQPESARRMSELAVDILRASPELVAPFWRSTRCSFEPGVTLRYLGATAFALRVMGLEVPAAGAAAPKLGTLVEHVMPLAIGRAGLGRGLQMRGAALVRYRTLQIVALALDKLTQVRAELQGRGWRVLDSELVAAVRQRVPEWQLVGLVLHDVSALPGGAQRAMLANVVQRVVRGYQQHFAEVVLESRFELGRLLPEDPVQMAAEPVAAHTLLHVLETLGAARNMRWTAAARSECATTNVGIVMYTYLYAVPPEVRHAARSACVRALGATGLFDHDLDEPALWLDALAALASPNATRAVRLGFVSEANRERGHLLVAFIEDAIKHAVKQPYKYADRVHAAGGDDGRLPCSPLLAAVVEASVLKTAVGNGALAAQLRGQTQESIAGEMQSNAVFAYVREVVCRVGESRSAWTAQRLALFLAPAAAAVLAPRVAKLSDAKDELKAANDRQHYATVEAAFSASVAGTIGYLATIYAPEQAVAVRDVKKLARGVRKKLETDLAQACADIETGLGPLMDKLAHAAREASVASVSRWLVAQAQGLQDGVRQAAFIVTIGWISLHDRGAGPSLWDHEPFISLAPEILQIDDSAFLDALLRHVLLSRTPGQLLASAVVRRLLAHAMLASRGSEQFCHIVARLVYRVMGSADVAATDVSFVCALMAEHVQALVTAGAQSLATRALERYSQLLGPMLIDSVPELQQALDFGTALLVRRTVPVWVSVSEATRIWAPFTSRIAAGVGELAEEEYVLAASVSALSMRSPTMDTDGSALTVYQLALLRVVAAALPDPTRVRLVRSLEEMAGSALTRVLCAAACAVFALCATDTSGSLNGCSTESVLAARVIALWAASLGSPDGADEVLDDAAERAAARSAMRATDSAVLGADRIRMRLPLLERAYSTAEPIDVSSVLDSLWASLESQSARTSVTQRVLARVLANDSQLRATACAWVQQRDVKLTQEQAQFLIWLVAVMAAECSTVQSRVVWDTDVHSQAIRDCCVELGARLFGADTPVHIADLATDTSLMFVATVFIQSANDSASVREFYARAKVALRGKAARKARATVLRAMAVRAQLISEQPDMVAEALAGTMDMAQHVILALKDTATPSASLDDLTAILASTAECCQQAAAQRSISQPELVLSTVFSAVSAVLDTVCRPFADGVDLSIDDVRQLAHQFSPAILRIVAFAVHTAALVGDGEPNAQLKWFACLKQLLNCRFYTVRVHATELRDIIALATQGLWKLARPSLSKWSGDLGDFFTLDGLETLAGAYSGSCSLADQLLLQVLQEYESTTCQSVRRVLVAFGPVAAEAYARERIGRVRYFIERDENDVGVMGQDVVANGLAAIDGGRLLRTVTEFPAVSVGASSDVSADTQLLSALVHHKCQGHAGAPDRSLVYDVQFVLPWVWTVVSSGAGVDVRRLIDSNALGVVITALSSDSERMRKLAYFTLDIAYKLVAEAHGLFGRNQCVLLLDVLRNGVVGRSDTQFPRVPFTHTLFVATSLPVTLRPEHEMYGAVNRLLLRRPWLKPSEVPLLRAVIRSSVEGVGARAYVLRLASQMSRAFGPCADAFRHADMVNTVLAQLSALGDVPAGRAALTMLFHISSRDNADALALHVSKSRFALLGWIRGQVSLEANSLETAAVQAADEQSVGPGVGAAVSNLTALVRVVTRVVANFPLARMASGNLVYNKYWVVQDPEQLNAAGQSAVVSVLQRTLNSLAMALSRVSVSYPVQVAILALVRACVGVAQMLADMQASTGEECQQSLAIQSSRLVPAALSVIRRIEPTVDAASTITGSTDAVVYYDPCTAASVATSLSADMLFYQPEYGMHRLYSVCVDELFAWTTSSAGPACSAVNMADAVSRVLAANTPSASKAIAWIREIN